MLLQQPVLVWPTAAQGSVNSGNSFAAVAGEAIGGHRAVYISTVDGKLYYADSTSANSRLLIGITLGAVVALGIGTVQLSGLVVNAAWAWTGSSPVYVGTTGLLTQTAPTSGYVVQVGTPYKGTGLSVAPRPLLFI